MARLINMTECLCDQANKVTNGEKHFLFYFAKKK